MYHADSDLNDTRQDEFNGWNHRKHPMERLENGVFEIKLSKDTLWNGCKVLAIVEHDGQELERIPLYARRVVQDPTTYLCAKYAAPTAKYAVQNKVIPKLSPELSTMDLSQKNGLEK